jgi:hypothetical protein
MMRFGITSPCFYMNITRARLIHPNHRRWRRKELAMVNIYTKTRPKGRSENRPFEDFVVEDHAAKSSARLNGENRRPNALVARVLQVNDKKSRITGGRPEA